MSKIINYTLLLTFLIQSPLTSQVANYEKGVIISSSGDTLKTLVNLDNDLILSKRIKYEVNEQKIVGGANEIRKVFFEESNILYESIIHSYIDQESGEKINIQRFARVLVDAAVPLLKIPLYPNEYNRTLSDIPTHTYYTRKNDKLYKLELVEETISEYEFKVVEKYKGGLKYLFQECKAILPEIEKTGYEDFQLIQLLIKYNDCIGNEIDETGSGPVVKVFDSSRDKKYILGLKIIKPLLSLSSNAELRNGLGFGAYIELSNKSLSNSLELGFGLDYLQHSISFTEKVEDETFVFLKQDVQSSIIRVPITFNYLLSSRKKFNPKIKLLLSANRNSIIGDKLVFREISSSDGTVETTIFSDIVTEDIFGSMSFGFGFGVEHNKFELNIFIENEQIFNTVSSISSVSRKRLFFGIGLNYYLINLN